MPEYLIAFNDEWVPEHTPEQLHAKGIAARAVIAEMRAAGVFVFTNGGIDASTAVCAVEARDGAPVFTDGPYVETKEHLGGICVLDVPDDAAARDWAGRLAVALDWPQEVHRFPGQERPDHTGQGGTVPDVTPPAGATPDIAQRAGAAPDIAQRAGAAPSGTPRTGEMPRYLLSVFGPAERTEYGAYPSREAMLEAFSDTGAFNEKLQHDGHFVFADGLAAAVAATTVDARGERPIVTDGPYLETKEHLGGFWVIQAADLDEALTLAAQASRACRGAVEVRPFVTAESFAAMLEQ